MKRLNITDKNKVSQLKIIRSDIDLKLKVLESVINQIKNSF